MPRPKFTLGQIVATPAALETFPREEVMSYLARHHAGDWGDTPKQDAKMNDKAVTSGDRIMSSYKRGEDKLWIITEGEGVDRVTTILLPEDY